MCCNDRIDITLYVLEKNSFRYVIVSIPHKGNNNNNNNNNNNTLHTLCLHTVTSSWNI